MVGLFGTSLAAVTSSLLHSFPSKISMELRKPKLKKLKEIAELVETGLNSRIILHDISNHLTSLSLCVEQLQERTEKTRKQIEYISGVLKKHLYRPANRTLLVHKEIRSVCRGFQSQLERRDIDLKINVQSNVRLRGDKKAFIHIVTNLLSNAADSFAAVPWREDRKIIVSTSSSRGTFFISVKDNGGGITPENIDHIFEEHFTTKKTGHGIGLFVVKQYIEEIFGGTIQVHSSSAGTEFVVKLPPGSTLPANRAKSMRLVRELKNRRKDLIQQKAFRGFRSRELSAVQDL